MSTTCTPCLVSNPNPAADFAVFPYCFGLRPRVGVCESAVWCPYYREPRVFSQAPCAAERRERIPGKRALRAPRRAA